MLSQAEIEILIQSALVGVVATAIATVPALALAYVLAFKEFAGKTLIGALAMIPAFIPTLAVLYLLYPYLGQLQPDIQPPLHPSDGSITKQAIAIAASLQAFPILVLMSTFLFSRINPQEINIARTLGSTQWHAFKTIVLPHTKSALFAALLLSFFRVFGECCAISITLHRINLHLNQQGHYDAQSVFLIAGSIALLALLTAIHLIKTASSNSK